MAALVYKDAVTCLDWAPKRESLLLHGTRNGSFRVYDTKEKKCICEMGPEQHPAFRDKRYHVGIHSAMCVVDIAEFCNIL